MPHNEEGEFELVLGNKQLLSVFFIVVVLLGVFFTMGYVVGRNTAPAPVQTAAARQPMVVEPPTSLSDPSKPSASSPKVEPPKPERVTRTETPKPEPVKAAASKPEPARPPVAEPPQPMAKKGEPKEPKDTKKGAREPSDAKVEAPGKGVFLQVSATKKAEAEVMADVLRKKGYKVSLSPVPDSSLHRVLVGPLAPSDVATTRQGLEAAGFKAFIRKL